MAEVMQSIFIDPPIAVARLGGSTVPQEAFQWIRNPRPRADSDTAIMPDWSLRILPDNSVEPYLPFEISFRDGGLIRPLCPFFEVWARMGEPGSDASAWRDERVTPALLQRFKIPLANVAIRVNAQNRKAARRTNNPDLRFGTFPPIVVTADQQIPVLLSAVSPGKVTQPMIPKGRHIPLGSIQVLRSKPQPSQGPEWVSFVNVEVLRFRFTPAKGQIYGPPTSAQPQPLPNFNRRTAVPVDPEFAFLNPKAGWTGAPEGPTQIVQPSDTYDGADVLQNRSLGVVDDTCEAQIEVAIKFPGANGRTLTATANVFVSPPDFAPDRRPFISLADEINDRSADSTQRNQAMTQEERDRWVEDLFERIYETLSLFNLDLWRASRAATLSGNRLLDKIIVNDELPRPKQALGGLDALRNKMFGIGPPTQDDPLPLTTHARMRHRALSDLQDLYDLVQESPDRLANLIRRTFEVETVENFNRTTMKMPPLMRNSNALPLTLTAWQYDLLMSWVADIIANPVVQPIGRKIAVAKRADERRTHVLDLLRSRNEGNPR
jgi:hypothetical protein